MPPQYFWNEILTILNIILYKPKCTYLPETNQTTRNPFSIQETLHQSESIQRNRTARVVYEISKRNFETKFQVSNVK